MADRSRASAVTRIPRQDRPTGRVRRAFTLDPPFTLQSLRHTFATTAVEAGMAINALGRAFDAAKEGVGEFLSRHRFAADLDEPSCKTIGGAGRERKQKTM